MFIALVALQLASIGLIKFNTGSIVSIVIVIFVPLVVLLPAKSEQATL